MALSLSTDLKNYIISKGIVEAISGTCGTGGTTTITIHNGTKPTDADAATNGTMLCIIENVGWGTNFGATNGTAALAVTGGYTGTAAATGTAGWARMTRIGTGYTGSAATFSIDGEVGTASTSVFVINSVSITSGGIVSLLTAPISLS
jgi:hypothetical protein